jgi:hypothetical protein
VPTAFAYVDEHGRRILWGFDLDPVRMTCVIEAGGRRSQGSGATAQEAYDSALESLKKEAA